VDEPMGDDDPRGSLSGEALHAGILEFDGFTSCL